MPASALILIAAALHLAVFVCYPHSGRFGVTFLFISVLLWSGLAVFLARAAAVLGAAGRAALAAGLVLLCAFSALSFLPQADGRSALSKLLSGRYPDGRDLYIGLRRVGVDAPRLLPPPLPEKPL